MEEESLLMKIVRTIPEILILQGAVILTLLMLLLNIGVHQKVFILAIFSKPNLALLLSIGIWGLLTIFFLNKGSWFSFWLYFVMSGIVLYMNLLNTVITKNYALAFFSLGFFILSLLILFTLYRVLSFPFLNSAKRWFEGFPRFIPHIEVDILNDKRMRSPGRMVTLTPEGCLVYSKYKLENLPNTIEVALNNLVVHCEVTSISISGDGFGHGLRFRPKNADEQKELIDFILRARSQGYV